jgi:hypothetical protein
MRVRSRDHERYPTYVDREVHPEWEDFEAFRDYVNDHLGTRPDGMSLDRKDNAKGYVPGNLRWATRIQQVRNRKSNVIITVGDISRCLTEWAEVTGIPAHVIHSRRRAGWTDQLAVAVPVRRKPS